MLDHIFPASRPTQTPIALAFGSTDLVSFNLCGSVDRYEAMFFQSGARVNEPAPTQAIDVQWCTRPACVLLLFLLILPNPAPAESWREADFECAKLGRRLTDLELLESLRTETKDHWVAARDVEIPSIVEMQSADPSCCTVTSDPKKNPYANDWEVDDVTWWRRLWISPSVYVGFSYGSPAASSISFSASGRLSTCGDVQYMTFSRNE